MDKQNKKHMNVQCVIPRIEALGSIPTGDMPGDKVQIGEDHVMKANFIFPQLMSILIPQLNDQAHHKAVISVHGGSGVGKSEIGSLLTHYLGRNGIKSYLMSGDNYPHRIPMYNDAERLRIFRTNGLKAIVSKDQYSKEIQAQLDILQKEDMDANPSLARESPWLLTYQRHGRAALADYLGSEQELDFDQVNGIIQAFKDGKQSIALKRMGRELSELWYENVDFSDTEVLVIEWTHGNNAHLIGVDIPILLNSTPEETMAHRKSRGRDGGVDSPFTTMVLGIEQELLHSQAANAKLIVTKSGELVNYQEYLKRMA